MGANYSFEVKNIEIWAPEFFKHNNSFIATVSKPGLQTSSHPQNSATHLLGLQGLQQTQANQANVKSNLTGMDTELQVRFCLKVVFQILRLGNFWHYNQF